MVCMFYHSRDDWQRLDPQSVMLQTYKGIKRVLQSYLCGASGNKRNFRMM